MMYLGNIAIGIAYNPPDWAYTSIILNFNVYTSYDTAVLFLSDSSVSSALFGLTNGKYKLVFENNTSNARAGLYIKFEVNDGNKTNIKVSRIGISGELSEQYGVDVYSGASAKLLKYINND